MNNHLLTLYRFQLFFILTLFSSSSALAAVTTIGKGPLDEFSFIAGGAEQVSITTTGDLNVKNNVKAKAFIGDGSALTGVAATDANTLGGIDTTGYLRTNILSARPIANADSADATFGVVVNYLTGAATNKPVGTDHSLLTLNYSNAWSTQLAGDWRTKDLFYRTQNNGIWNTWAKMWHSDNDGVGSALDADLLDGLNSTVFGQLSSAQTWSGINTFNANVIVNGSVSATSFVGDGSALTNVSPAAHTHTSLISAKTSTVDNGWLNDLNLTPRSMHSAGLSSGMVGSVEQNAPIGYGVLLNVPSYTSGQDGGAGQIIFPYGLGYTSNGNPIFRTGKYNNAGWSAWKTFMDKTWADSLYLGAGAKSADANLLDGLNSTVFGKLASAQAWSGINTFNANVIVNGSVSATSFVGDGSGLTGVVATNANTLGGVASPSFLRSDVSDAYGAGILSISNDLGQDVLVPGAINGLQIYQGTIGADALMSFHIAGDYAVHFGLDGETNDLTVGGWSMGAANKYKIWHAGNDGTGSTLDADLLDGLNSTVFGKLASAQAWSGINTFNANVIVNGSVSATSFVGDGSGLTGVVATNANTLGGVASPSFLRSDVSDAYGAGILSISNDLGQDVLVAGAINGLQIYQGTIGADALMTFHIGGDYAVHFGLDGETNDLTVGGWSMGAANKYKIWHAGNDGTGSTLDADLLDGLNTAYVSTPNTVVLRDGAGDVNARLLRSEYDATNPTVNYIMTQIDTISNNYVRPTTPAQFRAAVTDATYINVGETGDSLANNTVDSTEIEDNTLTAADLAPNSVGDSELIDNPTVATPTAAGHAANKAYVDAAVASAGGAYSGSINWNSCEVKNWCGHNNAGSVSIVCTVGKVLVSHSCSGVHTNYSLCYLNAANSLFINSGGAAGSYTCGSIKCCAVNP